MLINQFYDKGLAHASYAIVSAGKMIVIDPGRHPKPYYDFARQYKAAIVGVIETHPHADFVSSHLEIHQTTGATIFTSELTGAEYPHRAFDEGDSIELGDITLKALNTPGHSPDSICVLVEDEHGNDVAIFTGDTLFAGDVGRPDLREDAGNITAKKEELAKQMYYTTRNKLMLLPQDMTVYPAHGPGSLCGKNMSPELQSTIGRELRENYALQLMDELSFVKKLTADQPFVPKYFGYNVGLNKKGAPAFKSNIKIIPQNDSHFKPNGKLLIDVRSKEKFRAGHLVGAINLQDGEKFETWLGSIIAPTEKFYLIGDNIQALENAAYKAGKIGYELNIKAAVLFENGTASSAHLDMDDFKTNPEKYTVVDVRNPGEVEGASVFAKSIHIPLPDLRERINEIPSNKPIVVHCAAGYRSAAASSIISGLIKNTPVYDLGEEITNFTLKHA